MERKPSQLLTEFFDKNFSLPPIHWETVPADVDPWEVWNGYDESVEGWVPVWYPSSDPITGTSFGEFERAYYFNDDLERILRAMKRWPLWGSPTQKKHAAAYALLQLYCEITGRCQRI